MAHGISAYLGNSWMDALGNNTSFASAGVLTSDADVSWTNITGNQDATHFTCWDNISAGNFLFSGTIVAGAYTAGDTYTISAGNLTVSLTLAS